MRKLSWEWLFPRKQQSITCSRLRLLATNLRCRNQILFNRGNYCLFQANPTSLSLFFFSCFLGKKFTSPRSKFLRLDVYTTSFKTEIFFSKRFSLRFQGFEICFLRCTHLTRLNKMMLNWAANLKWFQNCYAKVQGNVSRNNWKIFQGLCLLRWKSFYIYENLKRAWSK